MITRKIDQDDWLAGHSYEWAKKISEQLAVTGGQLQVICLEKGNTEGLNANVYSLGKERGSTRWQRFWIFQKLAKKLVPLSDGIFSHQNPEYAIAVWPHAFLNRKQIVSWYTHKSVTWKSRLMLTLSHKVLTASEESFRIKSPKVVVVGHGIDLEKFKVISSKLKNEQKGQKFRIITVGRISPVKDLESLILAVKKLTEFGQSDIHLDIVGAAALPADQSYLSALKALVKKLELEESVMFLPPLPHHEISEIYAHADLFVNLSHTGSLDKAVLEACASGCPVVTSNEAFRRSFAPFADLILTDPNDSEMLANKIFAIKKLGRSDRAALTANLRAFVEKNHSLEKLTEKIVAGFV